jgi:dihydrofolate reductase
MNFTHNLKGAPDKVVGLHGATIMQQALPLGLVDEIRVHVIPVLLGGGTPLFGTLDSSITLERTEARATPAATHIAFRVIRKATALRRGAERVS